MKKPEGYISTRSSIVFRGCFKSGEGISNRWLSGDSEAFEGYEETGVITGGDRALQEGGEGD